MFDRCRNGWRLLNAVARQDSHAELTNRARFIPSPRHVRELGNLISWPGYVRFFLMNPCLPDDVPPTGCAMLVPSAT
jgi:hypothetical protein